MEKVKPWQIVLMIAAVGVLAFTAWRFVTAGKVAQPDRIITVDVLTGQLYEIKLGRAKGMILPAKHPDTGQRTLFPVVSEGAGWKVEPGFVDAALAGEIPNSKVKPSGELQTIPGKPKVFVLVP